MVNVGLKSPAQILIDAKVIFWDFDGVIKESVSIKTDAFVELFRPYGDDVCTMIKQHNVDKLGMSRFDKIPLYLLSSIFFNI